MGRNWCVLIPDEWGKSSDAKQSMKRSALGVLIPDEWGKSSDIKHYVKLFNNIGLNPPMSGASLPTHPFLSFRLELIVLIPDEWGKSSDVPLRRL